MVSDATPGPRARLVERLLVWVAEHGIGDVSLRTLATQIGTSHRMLHYHFGSREGVLAAVVEESCRRQQVVLAGLLAAYDDPIEAGFAFWAQLADQARTYAPIFFELSAAAMHGHAWAAELRGSLASWATSTATIFERAGHSPPEAELVARASVAMARGLLFDLALTGERVAVDRAMRLFVESTTPGRIA